MGAAGDAQGGQPLTKAIIHGRCLLSECGRGCREWGAESRACVYPCHGHGRSGCDRVNGGARSELHQHNLGNGAGGGGGEGGEREMPLSSTTEKTL